MQENARSLLFLLYAAILTQELTIIHLIHITNHHNANVTHPTYAIARQIVLNATAATS